MNDEAESRIEAQLQALRDPAYRAFQCGLMPTVDPETVLGVRTPQLRALARELSATPEAEAFLRELPHRYYEESNLHAFLLERLRDFDGCAAGVDAFLPFVDNWATCDSLRPAVFGKNLPRLEEKIRAWIASDQTYTIRFGVEMLMNFYLDGAFRPEYPEWVAALRSEEYYVNMMRAWYFATALAKQYDAVAPYLRERRLDRWTHNKTIQKAVESYRIPAERKALLRTLRER